MYKLSEFLRRSLMIFIIQGFSDDCFIFIFTKFLLMCSLAFFRCFLSHQEITRNFEPRPLFNLRRSLAQIPFIITGHKCLSILFLLPACNQNWTQQPPDDRHLETKRTNVYNCCAKCPAGQFRVNFWIYKLKPSTDSTSKGVG